uniref:Uncharacterized protein n=1 Tax=Rhizophora mucronata TaxID=61149 RepID=A0A2P2PYH0_RHIMU
MRSNMMPWLSFACYMEKHFRKLQKPEANKERNYHK